MSGTGRSFVSLLLSISLVESLTLTQTFSTQNWWMFSIFFSCIWRSSQQNLYWSQNLVWEVSVEMYCTRQRTPWYTGLREGQAGQGSNFFYLKHQKSKWKGIINLPPSQSSINLIIHLFWNKFMFTRWQCGEFRKYSESNMFLNRFCFLQQLFRLGQTQNIRTTQQDRIFTLHSLIQRSGLTGVCHHQC